MTVTNLANVLVKAGWSVNVEEAVSKINDDLAAFPEVVNESDEVVLLAYAAALHRSLR